MVRTSCTNLYNVLNHSLVINWRLDQIVLIRCFGVGGGGWVVDIRGRYKCKRHAESPDFRFPKVWVQEHQKSPLFSYPEGEGT